ncbi:type I-E CRISPR-associated protein Cse2/CasB [Limnohabitans sp.]|uniref:type I-E CRISPR-associated protein Cse2/CasB n=1 Tax=Limnohabitans sp. TaxID=1907725 RepID=UPI00333E3C72
MSTLELPEVDTQQAEPVAGHPIGKLAGFIAHADPGTRAALARLDPEAMRPHQIAALSRALIQAGLSPETWQPSTWKRWALVAHGMALAGHDGKGRIGSQLATAGVAGARVTKLLVSRGDAFLQIVPRLLRLLASKQVKPNWYDLSKLIHKNDAKEAADQEEAEALRLRIAGDYFSAIARGN